MGKLGTITIIVFKLSPGGDFKFLIIIVLEKQLKMFDGYLILFFQPPIDTSEKAIMITCIMICPFFSN